MELALFIETHSVNVNPPSGEHQHLHIIEGSHVRNHVLYLSCLSIGLYAAKVISLLKEKVSSALELI
jgi:hypothetical protein